MGYPYGKLPYGVNYDKFVKNLELQGKLNRSFQEIMADHFGGTPNNYNDWGKTQSIKDSTLDMTADERLKTISGEDSGSGFPMYFPKNITNVKTPTSPPIIPQTYTQPENLIPQPIISSLNPQATQQSRNPLPTPATPQPALQPSSEELPTNQKIDNSVLSGAQNQPSQSDSYALIRRLSDQYQNADPMTQTLMDAIYSYQNDYANATTDEARQLAHAGAERAREIARINELDLGLMSNGENLSPEQSNLAMVNAYLNQLGEAQKKFQSVQDNLANNYSESSNDHFWRLYDEYRQQGDSDRIAAIKAGRETTGYQQERVQSLQSAIDDYGIEGGVMNQFGVSLLGQLADEDNIMGSAYANAYATPKLNYERQQAMAQEILKQNSANQRKLAEMQYNAALQEMLENGRNVRADAKNQTTKQVTQFKEDRADARADKIEKGKNDRFNISEENKFKLAKLRAELKKLTDKNSGISDKEKYSRLKDWQTRVHQQLKDAQAEDEPDEEYIEELKNELSHIDHLVQTFQDPALQIEYPDATGNPQEDEKIAIEMWKNGATSDDIRIWFNASEKYDANTITKIIRKIMG